MRTVIHIKMNRVVDDSYDILIGTNLKRAASEIKKLFAGRRKFIITDTNLEKLYAAKFLTAVRGTEGGCHLLVVRAGEKSKNRKSKERLEDKLLKMGAGRDSLIIALGGGMIGDLAGFVAATLHRGVPYVQIPTSLLAQVDSSVGGKVAVDHPLGKNLIGAFHQPERVFIDPELLKTLPPREYRNGLAEVIKYAVILDRKLFEMLERSSPEVRSRGSRVLLKIVKRCCELKKSIVERDEREADLRRILNFGHTVGHALELLSRYRVAHGEAVSIGMVAEARVAASLHMIPHEALVRLKHLLTLYGLPTELPRGIDLDRLFLMTGRDKKAREGTVHYTLPEAIGRARTGVRLTPSDARALLRDQLR